MTCTSNNTFHYMTYMTVYDCVTLPAERPGTGNAPPLDCRESAGLWS